MVDFKCKECEFESTGWPNKQLAKAREDQHMAEHETHEPMDELKDFRAEYGVKV